MTEQIEKARHLMMNALEILDVEGAALPATYLQWSIDLLEAEGQSNPSDRKLAPLDFPTIM